MNNKLTDFCGNLSLPNDLVNTLCEISLFSFVSCIFFPGDENRCPDFSVVVTSPAIPSLTLVLNPNSAIVWLSDRLHFMRQVEKAAEVDLIGNKFRFKTFWQ